MRKIIFFLLVFLTMISYGKSSVTLNVGRMPDYIDPQISTESEIVVNFFMEGLAVKDKNGKSIPAIAQKWEVSQNGLVWTFYLRDAKWSNGEPITAKDFKDGWLRALKPETASEYAYLLYPIKNAEKFNDGKVLEKEVGIKVVNDKTLEVTLESPTPYFDDLITYKVFMPLNKKFFDKFRDYYFTKVGRILSNGAYNLKVWEHNSGKMVLEKNPNYWNEKNVKVDEIILNFSENDENVVKMFLNGKLDIVELPDNLAKEFKNDKRLVKVGDNSVFYLMLNTKNEVLKNVKIRKALAMAVDRKTLATEILNEKYIQTFVPKDVGIKGISKDFSDEVKIKQVEFDIEKAKKLLAEGLKETGITKFPELEIDYNDGGHNKLVAEYIQKSLNKNLGIKIKLSEMSLKKRILKMRQRNFDIVVAGWSGDFQDPISYLDMFESNNTNNTASYTNKKYDELVKSVKNSSDLFTRVSAMIELEEMISKEVPMITLYQKQRKYLINPKISGVGFISFDGELNLKDLEIKK